MVTRDWIYDSVKAGGCLPVERYLVSNQPLPSAPTETVADVSQHPHIPSSSLQASDMGAKTVTIPDDCEPFLSACNLYLGQGFTTAETRLYRQIILAGQGTRHSDFSSCVSHFICKDPISLNPGFVFIGIAFLFTNPICIVISNVWILFLLAQTNPKLYPLTGSWTV